MQFKKARLHLNQMQRPPSAGKGLSGAKEDAERRAYREAEKAQMLAKRVEQTMAKVSCLALLPVYLITCCVQLMLFCCTVLRLVMCSHSPA